MIVAADAPPAIRVGSDVMALDRQPLAHEAWNICQPVEMPLHGG